MIVSRRIALIQSDLKLEKLIQDGRPEEETEQGLRLVIRGKQKHMALDTSSPYMEMHVVAAKIIGPYTDDVVFATLQCLQHR